MSVRKKVYTNQCKKCSERGKHPDYDNTLKPYVEVCMWGNSKINKELVKQKGKKSINCKLLEKGKTDA